MIRINLLPVKAAKKRERAERTLVYIVVAVVATVAGLFWLDYVVASANEELKRKNELITQQIEKLKQEVGDFDLLKAQREQLMSQREVIRRLETGRVGPVHALLELSHILSPGGQPTMDAKWYEELLRENPNKAYDPTWDPKRVVITSYEDSGTNLTKLSGYAKDNSDLAEFVRRLDLSKYFDDPYIERSSATYDSPGTKGLKQIRFDMNVKVKY